MKSLKSIPLAEPFFFGKEKFFLNDCIKSGWITNSGKYLNKFELEIKKITKAKYCCALINGSSSLQLALRALNPQTSDEILVPSITFVASINSIKYNVGVRQQPKLNRDLALYAATCNADHKDLSIHF